jgi:hypothetical protein
MVLFVVCDERAGEGMVLTRLNQLGDQRRLRMLSSRSGGVPTVMWGVLLGAGAITIGFSYLFGMRNAVAQVLMTAGLAMTIALVLLSILALEQPLGGSVQNTLKRTIGAEVSSARPRCRLHV